MTIPIYVGTEPAQWLVTQVLKRSIMARTKCAVEFIPLDPQAILMPKLPMQTGFSFYRWAVPKLASFDGRAIYLDADICVLSDIGDLYEMHFDKPATARRETNGGQGYFTSVMVLDCDRLRHWDFPMWSAAAAINVHHYARTMWARPSAPNHNDFDPLPSCWNDLDIIKPDTRLIHFTDLGRQPWRWPRHPQAQVFREEIAMALADGYITATDLEREIRLRHVREDLLTQL